MVQSEIGDFGRRIRRVGRRLRKANSCPLVLYLARKRSGCSLRELGEWLGGTDYKTVSKTVARFAKKLECDRKLMKCTKRCLAKLSNVET